MSLATWKQEFYPVAATEVAKEDALKHSLQKWEGLQQANLDKHGVGTVDLSVRDENGSLRVNAFSCALCIQHPSCNGCPLVEVRGRPCCAEGVAAEKFPPWQAFSFHGDPGPMLKLLRAAKALEGAK